MKKLLLVCSLSLVALSPIFAMKKVQKRELIVFAAASMTETLNQVKPLFEKKYDDIEVVYNFDSSGTLQKQIENGASCDVFLSASTKQINALLKKDLLISGSRKDIFENKVVLAVNKDNKKDLKSFDDLFSRLKSKSVIISIGNSDVPVGQYTIKIFDYYKLDMKSVEKCLSLAGNVKEVVTQVKEGSVDAGIVYGTDCAAAGLEVVDMANVEMTGGKVVYPVAIVKNAKSIQDANNFIGFVTSDEARDIFTKAGLSLLY